MLEYWMASNETGHNGSDEAIEGVLQNPGSAVLFVGYPRWLLHLATGCCILFMLVGIPGNLFTIAALFRTRKLRNATAVFIMNLSISDLMFCCFNLPLATSTFWHSSWRYGALLCRLFPLLRYGLVAVSLFTILAITINRYVTIGHPNLYPTLYKTKFLIPMVLGTWILGFGVLIVTWFEKWGRFGLDPAIGSCSILPDVNGRSPKEFLFVVAFLTPCIAIVVCYARIFYIVRKTATKSRKRPITTNMDATEISHEQRSTSAKNEEEELSALGSSVTETAHCANSSPKRSSGPRMNHNRNSPSPSRSFVDDPLSKNHSYLEQNRIKEEEGKIDEETKLRKDDGENTEGEDINLNNEPRGNGVIEISDKIKTGLEIKIDDIPFADEREDLDSRETNDFSNHRNNRQSIEKPSANVRYKLERMASRASFIIESSLWVQRVTSAESEALKKSEGFVGSRSSISEKPHKKKRKLFRRESKYRSVEKRIRVDTPPRMSNKDRKLLKMILVIFSSFLICYLPITVTKTFKDAIDWRGLNIAGYILIYLTTCINPVVYVVMSSEYRSAYKNVLLCRSDHSVVNKIRKPLG